MDEPVMDLVAISRLRRMAASGEARQIRLAARVRLVEMAAVLGTTSASLSRWEKGLRVPGGAAADAWLRVLLLLDEA